MASPLQDSACAELPGSKAPATPPPTQPTERLSSWGLGSSGGAEEEEAGDPGRIPAAVFERDVSESNKDWSMMSTESMFGLQVAPSGDFTGFFLAHPEVMDSGTPPRTILAAGANTDADAKAKDAPVISPPFESIPELHEGAMKGNLVEDKMNYSKEPSQQDLQPEPAAASAEAANKAVPTPAEAEARADGRGAAADEQQPGGDSGSGSRTKGRLVLKLPLLLNADKRATCSGQHGISVNHH
ncbi:hypothetical protein ZEAMMB73_Zm00001d045334 [Zea mays]|uniref:Uncharacterized protein n=2 Tax=Zea mays TaxID=4577 RepID=A0A1D6NVB8_MAIZE|nr:hypothetical protein ZEAMMB73_Zm00001d045334 [Zea mays]